ncbi:hypothetical protein AN958_00675 [Leucoagaricus sp. SymC.cos]|nr:hypothetical protein AN958_00675 [Leucoagaricus sp. SymC.cos]
MPEAAMDSSARDPPPKCHPGTRVHIVSKLEHLRDDPNRQWDMIWLHGPAGTGKSAVAQTFAELCADRNHLGAAFFFSHPNKRNRPEKVLPTIAFQLAYHCPAYKSIITRVLAEDPHLLKKAMHVQFKQLIVRPLSQLQDQNHESVRHPFLILLDGMDECDGEKAQRDLIKMINDLVSVKHRFPILWLICSRPEPHLTHTFLRLPDCGREELALDEQSHDDVEKFLRDGFSALKDEYPHTIPSAWPDEEQLNIVLRFCSSLFAAASVTLNYVSDSAYANPVARLNGLVSFLERRGVVGPSHPLISLDMLYTRILSEIPDDISEALDEQSHDDVEKFLRDGFSALKDEYPHTIPSAWPDEEQLNIVLRFCSSLFAAASVTLNYVSDSAYANPVARLNGLTRDDVEKFLRDGFNALKDEYPHTIPSAWPDEEQLNIVLRFCFSLFAAASVVLNYISDSTYANPVARLNGLVSFLKRTGGTVGPSHPLISLDVLYMRILSEIPDDAFPTTRLILSYLLYRSRSYRYVDSCQTLCNLLRLDQNTFYTALHKLHSVLNIPAPEHAMDKPISFHHASFADFLRDTNRSGKFFIDEGKAYVDMVKTFLIWHDLDARLFHTSDGVIYNRAHEHDKPLPGLMWASANTEHFISRRIGDAAEFTFDFFQDLKRLNLRDEALLEQVHDQDFRYLCITRRLGDLLHWVNKQDPSSTLMHTEPLNDVDLCLLEYLKIMTGGEPVLPASSPPAWFSPFRIKYREYIFLGYGQNTVLICYTEADHDLYRFKLSADNPPSERDVEKYQQWLSRRGGARFTQEGQQEELLFNLT